MKTGTIEVLQGTVVKRATPGSVVFMASNEWHGFRNVGQGTASYLVVRLDPQGEETLPAPGCDVELRFDVPTGAPPTRLSDDFPTYWVLDVLGETNAGRFEESFLVPVYERPAAESPRSG